MLKRFLNKKGQANVVIMVLIILVGIVSIIIFWNIFNPILNKSAKEVNNDVFKNEIELKNAGLFLTGAIRVNVQRKSGDSNIDSLKFVFEDERGLTHVESVNENIAGLLESKSYFFSPIKDFGKLKKISVYPVINGKDGIGSSVESKGILNIPNGLISWWKFNGDLEDSVGKNNGKINGNVEFSEDEGKKSLHFNSGTVEIGNDPSLNLNGEFALVFWIKTNSKNSEVLRKGAVNPNYKIEIDEDGRIDFSFLSNGIIKNKKTLKDVSDEAWHHLVITNMMIYLDGKADTLLNVNDVLDTNQEDLIIGEGFNGYIREMIIFNRSLDMSQAEGIYKSYN